MKQHAGKKYQRFSILIALWKPVKLCNSKFLSVIERIAADNTLIKPN